MKPVCSIVIRCYNEEEHIGRLLSGIIQQTVTNVEIIVVDSGSTDATVAIASRYPIKLVSIQKEDFSFGRSLNLGVQAATSDYLVLASAHVYPVYEDWLEQMIKPFKDEKVALVYGKQRGTSTTKYAEHRVFARWFPEENNLRQKQPFCNNANAAIRRELWEQQRYDEDLTGLEDLDWAKRIIEKGYYLAYVADAEIIHIHNESYQQIFNRYRREGIAFKQIFPDEHFTLWDFFRLWIYNTFNDYSHALLDGKLAKELWDIPRFRLMQFWGTFRGYSQHKPVTRQLRQTFYYPSLNRIDTQKVDRDKLRIRYGTSDDIRANKTD